MTAKRSSTSGAALVMALSMTATTVLAQTVVKPPKNRYTPQQDVELGRAAADKIRQQYPLIKNDRITSYLTALGDRLVAAAPPELKEPVYEYSFTPVNLKEINAFALPGGPMFVQRGMFEAAASEGEVAGVMAHELSHVLLRHGTANASKAQSPWMQLGQIAGALGGAVIGGAAGSAIAQSSELGLGAWLLKFSREYEKDADLLGSQIMARAGYDPRALAHMFETIESQAASSGSGGPEWMSSHPNPGNRTQYITKEAGLLTIARAADDHEFAAIKSAFASLGPAKSMRDLAKARSGSGGDAVRTVGTPGQPVPPPSLKDRIIRTNVFQAAVPDNWTSVPSNSTLKVVPQNGYGQLDGQTIFSHGIEFGVARAESPDLLEATEAWLSAIRQSNPELRSAGEQKARQISQRMALSTPLVNASLLGGQETIDVQTTFLRDGRLFYFLTVVPEHEAEAFQEAFRRVGESIRFTDAR